MFEVAIIFFVILLTVLVFGGWIIVTLLRLTARGVLALFRQDQGSQFIPVTPIGETRHNHGDCDALNPPGARYCRRCGRLLPKAQNVQVRRVSNV